MQNSIENVKQSSVGLIFNSYYDFIFQRACDSYEKKIESSIRSQPSDEELLKSHNSAVEMAVNYFTEELSANVSNERFNKLLVSLRDIIAIKFQNYRQKNKDRIENEKQQKIAFYKPCFSKPIGPYDKNARKSENAVFLQLPCPGAYLASCETEEKIWQCPQCDEYLVYGFDGYFYCLCGRAGVYSFQFKCNSKEHQSMSYLQFTQKRLRQLLNNKEINIILFGEIGVGKSTFINGLANYLTFSSLNEAKNNKLRCLIASSFTMTDNNYQQRVIACGEDKNEELIIGQSATQEPKTYVFKYDNKFIRIIDTPGISDIRGSEQDKKNMDRILRYISNLENLNAICILLKPNNARLGVTFRFCIKELFSHLHRDASRNIVFCFTNARSTFYRPGDTMPALESLLRENNEVEIKLSKETIYCMDNESFRFLCALHNGIEFDEKECNNYSESWDKSVIETKRMVEYISGIQPHSVSNTLSINETRKIINNLSKPMIDITQNILINIKVVEDKKREILNHIESENNLKGKLHLNVIQLEANQLGFPQTVCTAQKCVKYHNIEGSNHYTTEFITHCHTKCYLTGITPETYPNPELKRCAAMNGTVYCSKCGCGWDKHMHVTYEQKQVAMQVVDEVVEDLIKDKQTMRKGIELQIKKMEKFVKELNDEKNRIIVISAKFGGYLRTNSIVPYNDALGEYLEVLIRIEKDKVSVGGDRKILEGLQKMKCSYNEEVRLLNESMKTAGKCEQLMPTDMMALVNELFSLKHKGKELKKIMDIMVASKSQICKYHENNFVSPIK